MRKFWIVAALLLFVAGVLLSRKVPPAAPVIPPVAPVPAASARSTATPHAAPAVPPLRSAVKAIAPQATAPAGGAPAASKVNPRYSQVPKDPVVEFKVVGDKAIGFGDVVLGNVPPGFNLQSGLTEVPRPRLWNRGEIPYHIQPEVKKPERIERAIEMFHRQTRLKFVPYQSQPDALVFTTTQEHCFSYLGRVGGLQEVFISDGCDPVSIAHEILHALGFVHEQSRTDRDQHVTIFWDHIEEKYQGQFAMVPEIWMEAYADSPFDPGSVLMYDPRAFAARDGLETMKLKNGAAIQPAATGLSATDVERVNRLYGD